MTSSFLGRPTTPDDAPLLEALTTEFVKSGYRMRPLVRALVRSPAYRKSNNMASQTWREGEGAPVLAQTPNDAIHANVNARGDQAGGTQ